MNPIIGILANLTPTNDSASLQEKVYVNNTYISAVEKAGGVPIIIPVNTNRDNIKRQIDLIDGLIISGGADINPILYKEEPLVGLGYFNNDNDEFDIIATRIALILDKPIFGICRGLQVLNVCLGGTLYQDINHIESSYIKHSQDAKRFMGSHSITISEWSKLAEILGTDSIVNSFHHQSVKDLGKGLVVSASAKDGVIEAIELKGDKYAIGVQWHPEEMIEENEKMLLLFKKLVDVAKQKKEEKEENE